MENKDIVILTDDIICVKDWLCEPGNEKYYATIGMLIKSKLIENKIPSTYVGDKSEIPFKKHKFHRKPENYHEMWLKNFTACLDKNKVMDISHIPTRDKKISECMSLAYDTLDNDIRSKNRYIKDDVQHSAKK